MLASTILANTFSIPEHVALSLPNVYHIQYAMRKQVIPND